MKHLEQNWMDVDNNVARMEPDDFILPEDDGGEQRQRDTDLKAEIKRISDWNRSLTNPLLKKQAE